MYELINKVPIKIKEYKGQRVVTFKDIDTVHNRPEGTARKRFNDNKKHFIEGVDFFKVCASEIRTHKIMEMSPKAHEDIILVTETGYLMLVKSFRDELSWNVQRQLVNTYFRVQLMSNSYDNTIYKKLELLEKKIDALEKKSGNIAEETVRTIIPCSYLLDRKIDVLEKKVDELEKKSGRIIRVIRDNSKLLAVLMKMLK